MSVISFKPIYLKENMGHGNARRVSLDNCRNELIALMDADDISLRERFRLQLECFLEDCSLSICGGQITEFSGEPSNIIDRREVPFTNGDIRHYLKKCCPMNQVSVMLRKNEVQKAGGYQDWYCDEDYYLWTRMALTGCSFANVPETLVNVRVGNEMAARRGGLKYFCSEARLQTYMLKHGIISPIRWLYNVGIRFGGEVILSDRMREKALYLFRSKADIADTPQMSDAIVIHNGALEETPHKEDNIENLDMQDINNSTQEKSYPPFSVAMCVYGKDNPEWFDTALYSVIDQTVQPDEIVLVVDGPIPDSIQNVIDKYSEICTGGGTAEVSFTYAIRFRVIKSDVNQGLGKCLRLAVIECRNELIARMDSDDIAVRDRFEKQLDYLAIHPDIDILGGQIEEFIGEPDCVAGKRIVPLSDNDCKMYIKRRCPFNHMSVIYKRSAVIDAGNYQDWFWNEDLYLWIRMALRGYKFANLPETLVKVRVGEEMYARRGGLKYFHSEEGLQRLMLRNGMIALPRYMINVSERLILQVLLPNKIRGWVFRKLARK